MVKTKTHNPITGIDTLKVTRVSKQQALQRAGRAGRDGDGFCYRAYTNAEYNQFPDVTTPEILRSNLATVALHLLNMNIDCSNFDFLDAPPKNAVNSAVRQLYCLGAISSIQQPALTELGSKMSKFPLDPQYSRILLAAPSFNCVEEVINIISVLASESIFFCPSDRRDVAREKHAKFEAKEGDHITLLRVFRAFIKAEKQNKWCCDNFLNSRNLVYAQNVRHQLIELCHRLGMQMSTCGADTEPLRQCLLTGLFNNVAELTSDNHYMTLTGRQRVKIHPSSVFSDKEKPRLIVFSELIATSKTYVRTVSAIEEDWIADLKPKFHQNATIEH